MIGIVVVSHSAKLAEGTRELANTMTQGRVPIAVAGGIDDEENPFGTDPIKVAAAIDSVYSDEGVIVLMDLGSALLSAETALEFIDPDRQANVYLCEAPFVEGTIAAAVQAGAGSSIQQVLAEARGALAAKAAQLAPVLNTPPLKSTVDSPFTLIWEGAAPTLTRKITVPNALGLHARPAAKLVVLIGEYDVAVTIRNGDRTANGASINQVVTLGARHGNELDFAATGRDADAVLNAIEAFAAANFGDALTDTTTPSSIVTLNATQPSDSEHPAGTLVGIPAAPGIAIAPALRLDLDVPTVDRRTVAERDTERARLDRAIAATLAQLETTRADTERRVGKQEASIFAAHRLMLQDPELLEAVQTRFTAQSENAEAVWWDTIQQVADTYRQLSDPYLQARAADVLDVGRQVLRQLGGAEAKRDALSSSVIIVTQEISPSDLASLDAEFVAGIVTAEGGATSHSAILARSMGIPAVVGVATGLDAIENGQDIGLDGAKGWVYPTPSDAQLSDLRAAQSALHTAQTTYQEQSKAPAITRDGRRIEVAANLGSPADALKGFDQGAEGVGLFRTEFLFMERSEQPNEEEQFEAYRAASEGIQGQPVIIRTLDIGGDKPVPYMMSATEANPFLGHRGIRNWLDSPAIARTQLRAICRVSHQHAVRVMFPMVSTVEEVHRAKALLADVQAELAQEGIGYDPDMAVGIMIEVPAAVWSAAALAQEVDFFSIGTNDLTQYVMAADRGNAKVSTLVSYFQPAVLTAIQQVATAAHTAGIWAGVCGEMAGNPEALPLLVGLGIDELSMSATAIPEIKARIRDLSYESAQEIARHALTLPSAEAIREYLRTAERGT